LKNHKKFKGVPFILETKSKEMDQFRGVDLEDSWIINWYFDKNKKSLVINLEASLWPESPYYEAPKPGEYTCYKKSLLIFESVESVEGLALVSEVKGNQDLDGSVDYGNIYGLRKDENTFRFETDFAEIAVKCGSLMFFIEKTK
jgi:hypothetical protein